MLTRQDVESAYSLLLARPAEPDAIEYWMQNAESSLDLIRGLMGSDEFRANRIPKLIKAGFSFSSLTPMEQPDSGEPMQAAIHTGLRQIDVSTVNSPDARPGTVVIKVGAVGICGTDLSSYRKDSSRHSVPQGHEYAGVIVAVGEGVSPARVGQRVTADVFLNAMCGKCEFCVRGLAFHCIDKEAPLRTGGFAQYVRVKDSATFDLPDSVDDSLGALVEPLAVGVHAMRRVGVKPGMTGVVIGAGSIGLGAVAAALDAGATKVFVVAKHAFQGELARSIGAEDFFPDTETALKRVLEANSHGVDFAVEAVGGSQSTLDLACRLVRPLGSVGIVGAFDPGFKGVDVFPPLVKELTFQFSNCYGYLDGKHDFEIAIDLLARKADQLRKLITHEFSMADAARAFQIADDKQSGAVKVQIRP
ncbi:alcohol dehydrogenase catalytic domain-containing protein [Paraburkholderia sp. CNPSo 3076]|uniref:zinc-dependent alcohol dehydrogenase n=1 Tax=Paraburkholderia sp. CNPSo 3076 TaxID=2940936 RepID=UPI002258C1FD|nr:alcohol dehydrogenase catalytic domain-containing protein [Paraburkholderia sp. CNPSo 3076]MCX5543188.1 alcohol dehydrogenase catalytic domain-containing protein [Paraburkholderia sp. CNPSo 3076]